MRVFFYVKIYAFLSVSINHVEYFKGKYGMLYTENILRKGVQIFQKSTKEDVKICRVSENIFYFWLMESVELEIYIQQLNCTVHSYIDRDISDDLDAFFVGIFFQFHPLLIEFELHILLEFNIKI